ncbi:hypothetical protein Dimus_012359 [Dionaea muscipula]
MNDFLFLGLVDPELVVPVGSGEVLGNKCGWPHYPFALIPIGLAEIWFWGLDVSVARDPLKDVHGEVLFGEGDTDGVDDQGAFLQVCRLVYRWFCLLSDVLVSAIGFAYPSAVERYDRSLGGDHGGVHATLWIMVFLLSCSAG